MSDNRLPAFVRMEELFDVSVREILRPLKKRSQKTLDGVLEFGLRKGRSQLRIVKEDDLIEHLLRVAIEMQLLTTDDEIEASEQIKLIVQRNGL